MAVLLTACGGNKLELDLEKTENVIASEAVGQKIIEEAGYEKEDIEIIKICEAFESGKEDQGFNGQYIVHWQTTDGEYKRELSMTREYKAGYSTSRLEPIDDRCMTVE